MLKDKEIVMKIKASTLGLIIASSLFVVVGTAQASCYKNQPGWHMVSKHCNIKPATTWQQYTSGERLQPVTGRGSLFMLR
jgi:hypothetical protein